jgi:hypothetical protein
MRSPFGLVGVQDGLGHGAGEHAGEFPRQVGGIAQAGAHALADKWRGEMGGVTEQEHTPVSPLAGDLRAEGVPGRADDLQPLHRYVCGPRGQ